MSVAARLMARFGVSEPIVGDLLEARRGRSRVWYWRQSVSAIVLTAARTVSQRPLGALRVSILSAGTLFIWYHSVLKAYLWATPFVNDMTTHSRLFMFGWHVYTLPLNVLWCIGATLSGRMAVRLGKRNTPAFAFVAFASQLPLVLWWGLPLVFRLREALLQYHLPLRFAAGWVFDLAVILVGMPFCALFGALRSHDGDLPIADTA